MPKPQPVATPCPGAGRARVGRAWADEGFGHAGEAALSLEADARREHPVAGAARLRRVRHVGPLRRDGRPGPGRGGELAVRRTRRGRTRRQCRRRRGRALRPNPVDRSPAGARCHRARACEHRSIGRGPPRLCRPARRQRRSTQRRRASPTSRGRSRRCCRCTAAPSTTTRSGSRTSGRSRTRRSTARRRSSGRSTTRDLAAGFETMLDARRQQVALGDQAAVLLYTIRQGAPDETGVLGNAWVERDRRRAHCTPAVHDRDQPGCARGLRTRRRRAGHREPDPSRRGDRWSARER